MLDLLLLARAEIEATPEKPALQVNVSSDEEVVEDRHPLEEGDVLKGPRDPQTRTGGGRAVGDVVSIEGDGAPLWLIPAAYAVEHARLAGPVRADDREDLTIANREAETPQSHDPSEAEADVLDCELDRPLQGTRHALPRANFFRRLETI